MIEYSFSNVFFFAIIVVLCLAIDLFAHKQDKPVSIKSAVLWTIFWIVISLLFAFYVYETHGVADASAYLSGYILEKTLSVDNLFVLMAIFTSFGIPDKFQHRVLFYGILGALILRLLFVGLGTAFINYFGDAALTIFGIFIVWSAFKMMQAAGLGALIYSLIRKETLPVRKQKEETDFKKHWSIRFFRYFFPVTPKMEGHKFFIKGAATPLFLCLITVEFADIMFAFDSVPAVIAITEKPFLVYTSNIFAILGMRSMYFCLAAAKNALVHLEKAVIGILLYIGLKMLAEVFFDTHISATTSLWVVLSFLGIGVVASLIFPAKKK